MRLRPKFKLFKLILFHHEETVVLPHVAGGWVPLSTTGGSNDQTQLNRSSLMDVRQIPKYGA